MNYRASLRVILKVFPWEIFSNLVLTAFLLKVAFEFLFTPFLYLLARFLKVFPWEIFSNLVLTAFLLKVAFEFLFTPFLYLLARFLKKQEKLDTYDYKVSYNPFSLN